MSGANIGGKERKQKTIDEEIEAQQEKLRKLLERKKKQEKLARERNEKAVLSLIKREGLNTIPVEIWEKAIPQLKRIIKDADSEEKESNELDGNLVDLTTAENY